MSRLDLTKFIGVKPECVVEYERLQEQYSLVSRLAANVSQLQQTFAGVASGHIRSAADSIRAAAATLKSEMAQVQSSVLTWSRDQSCIRIYDNDSFATSEEEYEF